MKQFILMIEDAPDVRAVVEGALTTDSLAVVSATTAEEALKLVRKQKFDLILLDIHLPDRDGLEFFLELQKAAKGGASKDVPIIFLTGKADVSHKVTAFSLGAEDYIVKPFNIVELRARVEARLKKVTQKKDRAEEFVVAGYRVEVPAQRVYKGGKELGLTPLEFKIFHMLVKKPDRIFSREEILDKVWGTDVHVLNRTVDAHICTLRKKLEPDDDCIESVSGEGYRFIPKK